MKKFFLLALLGLLTPPIFGAEKISLGPYEGFKMPLPLAETSSGPFSFMGDCWPPFQFDPNETFWAASSDQHYFVVESKDQLLLLDTQSGRTIYSISVGDKRCVIFSRDNKKALIRSSYSGKPDTPIDAYIVSLPDGVELKHLKLPHPHPHTRILSSEDFSRLALVYINENAFNVLFYDVSSEKTLGEAERIEPWDVNGNKKQRMLFDSKSGLFVAGLASYSSAKASAAHHLSEDPPDFYGIGGGPAVAFISPDSGAVIKGFSFSDVLSRDFEVVYRIENGKFVGYSTKDETIVVTHVLEPSDKLNPRDASIYRRAGSDIVFVFWKPRGDQNVESARYLGWDETNRKVLYQKNLEGGWEFDKDKTNYSDSIKIEPRSEFHPKRERIGLSVNILTGEATEIHDRFFENEPKIEDINLALEIAGRPKSPDKSSMDTVFGNWLKPQEILILSGGGWTNNKDAAVVDLRARKVLFRAPDKGIETQKLGSETSKWVALKIRKGPEEHSYLLDLDHLDFSLSREITNWKKIVDYGGLLGGTMRVLVEDPSSHELAMKLFDWRRGELVDPVATLGKVVASIPLDHGEMIMLGTDKGSRKNPWFAHLFLKEVRKP